MLSIQPKHIASSTASIYQNVLSFCGLPRFTITQHSHKINKDKDKDAKPSDIKIGSTFGIGDFIVLGENAGKDANGDFNINEYEKDVRHEYGHTKQYDNMGPVKFIKDVAIPSMRGYTKSSKGEKINYYAQPWERGADINGKVDRGKEYAGLEGIGTSQDDSSYYVKLKKFKQKILKFLDELNE